MQVDPNSITNNKPQPGQVPAPLYDIEKLKREHGSPLYLVEVAPETEGMEPLVFIFKKCDRKTLSACAKIGQADLTAASEVMIKNTLVFGDNKAIEDVSVFTALSEKMEVINAARTATLKNL